MKVSKMMREVEDMIFMMESGYSTEQWENKEKVDLLRYEEGKKLRNKIDDCFYKNDVEYDVDENDFEYVEDLLSELDMKIRKYEDDMDENYFEYKNNFLSELNMNMNIKIK